MHWMQAWACVWVVVINRIAVWANNLRPKFHAATYADSFEPRLMLALATAARHGWQPLLLGLAKPTGWGSEAGPQLIETAKFLDRGDIADDDVVLIFDSADVVFLGSDDEIVDRFVQMEQAQGTNLFYNAETACSHTARCHEYPKIDSPWMYLNGGVLIGRANIIRRLFRTRSIANDSVILDRRGNPMRHQNWHSDFFLDNRDAIALDSHCELMQVVWEVSGVCKRSVESPGGSSLIVSGDKLINTITNTTPLILHFAGPGHWPDMFDDRRMGTCCAYEVFRLIGHPDLAGHQELIFNRPVHLLGAAPWKAVCHFDMGAADMLAIRVAYVGNAVIYLWLHADLLQPKSFMVLVVLGIALALAILNYRLNALAILNYRLRRRCCKRKPKHLSCKYNV